MRKIVFLFLTVMCAFAQLCRGQIGETKGELAKRYGKATPQEKMLTAPYDALVDEYCSFQHEKLMIYAGLKEGKAVMFMYQKADKSPMSQQEVFAILNVAVAKPDWVLLSGHDQNPRWRKGDSSVYAYFYPEADAAGAPGRLVRVQTVALDEVYAKLRHADIVPADPQTPLFQIFEAQLQLLKADHPKMTWDSNKPLLSVYYVRDLQLAGDKKGVLIALNDKDTTALAALTEKFKGSYLILKTGSDAMEVMHITAPIEDGYIGFKDPEEGPVAEYLRKRFKIGEFK